MTSFQLKNSAELDKNADLKSRFKSLCEELFKFGEREGVSITPYISENLIHFSSLDFETKKIVTESLSIYVNICQQTILSGHSLSSSRQFTWSALKMYKLKPKSDLFNQLTEDQVIEFYNSDNIQIFRNFVFFKLCSYSIEDLYCRPWFELFYRDPGVTQTILSEFSKVFSRKVTDTFKTEIPDHDLKEINSAYKNTVNMSVDFCSPLYSEGNNQDHLIVVESCSLVGKELTNEQKESRLKTHYEQMQQF